MNEKKFYKVAIYLRLSRDDEDITGSKSESNSIRSQKDMICSFVKKQDNLKIYDTYVDDGFSGTNFERPEFKRMMQDIEAGNVTCVIVKDLSRLGRDYIEAGRLIQKTFPAFSVRFIALTDQYDSLTADYNETSLVIPMKNFVNDSYARDISAKVRSHQKVKRENGDFIGAFAVYGYKKSKKNRNRLVPDAYAATIVRNIYAWKMEGYSNIAIAKLLDKMGILSPMEYKKIQGERFQTGFVTGVKTKWSAVAIKRILTNENYIGTLVQGKEEKVNYKVKKSVRKPEEEWTKVQDAHEAIVSREDFEVVQGLMKIETRAGGGERTAHMYAGILFCADCMEPMVRRVNRYKGKEMVSYICSTKNKGGDCSRHTISEKELNNLVLTILNQHISMFLNKSKVLRNVEQMEITFDEVIAFDKEFKRLCSERDKYLSLGEGMNEDVKKKIITKDEFKRFSAIFKIQYQELEQTICKQEKTRKKLSQSVAEAGANRKRIKNKMQLVELDRMILLSFVKRILVYEDKRVYLELRYKELFSQMFM